MLFPADGRGWWTRLFFEARCRWSAILASEVEPRVHGPQERRKVAIRTEEQQKMGFDNASVEAGIC